MSTRSQQRLSASSLALLAVAFVFAISVSNQLFKSWRVDLTDNELYTLSDGTRNLLGNIQDPINLYFYFSNEATASIPSLRSYANRVQEMLEEFEDRAGGKIHLTVIDPLPFSEDEDRAAQFGLQAVRLNSIPDPVYLGLAGTDSVDKEEVIAFFQPDKEEFLEYDIAKLISTLANTQRTLIGVVSGVDMTGAFDPQTGRMQPAWVVYQQAQQLFELRNLGTTFDKIDNDVNLLWIVQPKNLGNDTLYAIDQFMLRGGKAIIFVDPLADMDPANMEGMPQEMPPIGQSSDIPLLFKTWGVEFSSEEVVADAQIALQISGMDRRPIRHYGFLGVTSDLMSGADVVTANLSTVNLATAGHLQPAQDSTVLFEPLITSSVVSQSLPATRFSYLPDPSSLQKGFVASGQEFVLAARLSGNLQSAFPNGRPTTTVSSGDGDPDDDSADAGHLAESTAPANIIIAADVDILGDRLWVQLQGFFGQQIANTFASNGAFVINALENLSGSSDLIGVRSRGSFTRPFTRVEKLRAEAEANFRETEQRLQSELADTERRLGELQSSREDTGDLLLTPEQQAEIDRFIDQRTSIRKELRAVQRGLDEDIDRLGTVLKVINIGLVPFLLALFALFAVWRRNRSPAT